MKAKRMICALIVLLLSGGRVQAYSAAAYAVISAETGVLLDGKEENRCLPMASTTKIMTGLLAAEDADIDRIITVSPASAGIEGSSMYLKAGEQLPLRDVLYGLMLCSGNDAAECIAEQCGGRDVFIQRMNTRAQELGLKDTHFDNPSGLDGATHHTTALELARLAAAALRNPTFAEVVATKSYSSGTRSMVNHNKLLRMYDGAIGVKTGYTMTAGRCLVSAAQKNGRTVIAVTLNDGNDWNDHIQMLDAAFAGMHEEKRTKGETACTISVQSGLCDTINAVYAEDVSAALLKQEQVDIEISSAEFLYAPVQEGTVCGHVRLLCGDTVLAETDLLSGSSAEQDTAQEDTGRKERFLLWWDRIRGRTVT